MRASTEPMSDRHGRRLVDKLRVMLANMPPILRPLLRDLLKRQPIMAIVGEEMAVWGEDADRAFTSRGVHEQRP